MVSGDPKQKYLKNMHSPAGLDVLSDWTKPGFTEWNKQALYLETTEFGNHSEIQSPFWAYLTDNLHRLLKKQMKYKIVVGTVGCNVPA